MAQPVKVALIQSKGCMDKDANLKLTCELVRTAVKTHSARMVILPECFNSPYREQYFHEYAELIPNGMTTKMLSDLAKELKIYLVAGTYPERDAKNTKVVYNTMPVFGPDGNLIAKHRKMHLFDVDIPGKITFKESSAITPGDVLTTFDAFGMKFGMAVCHDSLFTEMAMLYRQMGCDAIIYPCAYHVTVAPRMWEMVFRGRAHDNQIYVAAVSEAQDPSAVYNSFGHSMMVDPWGEIIAQAGAEQDIVITTMDPAVINSARSQVPLFKQRRTDVYETRYKK